MMLYSCTHMASGRQRVKMWVSLFGEGGLGGTAPSWPHAAHSSQMLSAAAATDALARDALSIISLWIIYQPTYHLV